jgi:hypothetical protein
MRTPETPDRRFKNSIWCPSPGTACPTRRGELGSGSRGLGLSLRLGWKMPWEAVRGTVNLILIVRKGRRRKEDRNSRSDGEEAGSSSIRVFLSFLLNPDTKTHTTIYTTHTLHPLLTVDPSIGTVLATWTSRTLGFLLCRLSHLFFSCMRHIWHGSRAHTG